MQQRPVISSGPIGQSVHYPAVSASCCLQAREGSPASARTARWRALFQLFCKCPGAPGWSQPLRCHRWLGDKGRCQDALPFLCSSVRRPRSFGKEQPQELDRSHRPFFTTFSLPLPPSSGAVSAWSGSRLILLIIVNNPSPASAQTATAQAAKATEAAGHK